MDHALKLAVQASGGQAALGRHLGITGQAISQWDRVPPNRVITVEAASGIHRSILRPDLHPREVAA